MAFELAPIAESSHGAAFEVKIKSSGAEHVQSAAKARLESYSQAPLPSLLQSRPMSKTVTEERAEKVKQQNAQKRLAAERAFAEFLASTSAKKQGLQEQLEKAKENRAVALADRKARAGLHFEHVMTTTCNHQQRQAESKEALRLRLEESLEQKQALHIASLSDRSGRAFQHNEAVVGKVKEVMERQAEERRGRNPSQRFAALVERLIERRLPHL